MILKRTLKIVMNDIQISIIIPVYNIEQYVRKNVESLLALKDDKIEFIYVDDGSTDRSAAILSEYIEKDKRIVLIRQKNAGLSAARNTGIDAANGKWILFVDGDDWLDAEATECFFKEREEGYDIIWGGLSTVKENDAGHDFFTRGDIKREMRSGTEWLKAGMVDYTACVYLYRMELIKKYDIRFPVGLLHEDMEYVPKVFTYAQKVKRTNISYYRYLERENSISTTKNIKRSQDLLRVADNLNNFYEQKQMRELDIYVKDYLASLCENAIHIAVLAHIEIQEIFQGDEEKKEKAIRYLLNGSRICDKLAGCMLQLGLSKCYEKMYLLYDRIR